jgi:Xaa-Pro aminopeptidase
LKRLRQRLREKNLDSFLASEGANIRYLSGFTGKEGYLIVNSDEAFLLVDSRYTLQAKQEAAAEIKVKEYKDLFHDFWSDYTRQNQKITLGFETRNLTHSQLLKLRKFTKGIKLVPTEFLVDGLRAVKEDKEVTLIREAVSVADKALEFVKELIRPGVSERELSWEVEKFCREQGAEKMAWEPAIVASGENAALPHHKVSERKIERNDLVLFDFGAVVEGYHSDVSRVFFVGLPTQEQRMVYQAVLEAQNLGKSLLFSGKAGAEADQSVKNYLKNFGPGAYEHSLGHGVGLGVHELPILSLARGDVLEKNSVVTVEPGIYRAGWGGVRIEDIVIITSKGVETLTQFPKDLESVIV